jgi:hypothetical protein
MSQTFSALQSSVTTFNQIYGIINNNIDAIRSQWSGTSTPDSPVVGQPFYNTTTGKITIWDGTSWIDPANTSTTVLANTAELLEARGTTASLNTRLSVSLNDDGTLKGAAPVGDWWMTEADDVAFVDASTFTVSGDKTAIYVKNRALYLTQISNDYDYVVSSSYNGGTDLTTVVTLNSNVDSGLSAVEYGQPVENAPVVTVTSIGAEPADADIVKAPGGVLPVLDGSNLTGISAAGGPPQTIVQANMGSRPVGWAAEDSDLPTETLTFSGGTLTVEPGLQVAAADSGSIVLSEVLSVGQTIDMSGQADGEYYVYADLNTDGTFDTFGFSSIAPEVGFYRVTPGSDLYNPATLTMVDSTDTPIRRVYVGEVTITTSLISAVYSYALGTFVTLPVYNGTDVVVNTEYSEIKPYPGPVEAVAEIYSTTMSKWVRTANVYNSNSNVHYGIWVRTIDNSFIYVNTARNYITAITDSGTALTTGKCRIIVRRGY